LVFSSPLLGHGLLLNTLPNEGLNKPNDLWMTEAMVRLLAAPWVQSSVSGKGKCTAVGYHWLMPISCHFPVPYCKTLLQVASLIYVSSPTGYNECLDHSHKNVTLFRPTLLCYVHFMQGGANFSELGGPKYFHLFPSLSCSPLPFPAPSPIPSVPCFSIPFPQIQVEVWGSAVSSPSGSGQSPATKRVLVHFGLKIMLHVISSLKSFFMEKCYFVTEYPCRPSPCVPFPSQIQLRVGGVLEAFWRIFGLSEFPW